MADQPAGLSPRAAIAMLTLKLRAAEQEALAAEAEEAAVDHEKARRELRERLDAMVAERRQFHATAYAAASATLAADVEAARRAAAVTATTIPADPLRLIGESTGVDVAASASPATEQQPASVDTAAVAPTSAAPANIAALMPTPVQAPATAGEASVLAPTPGSGPNIVITGASANASGQPVSIVLDAEVLGKVFAKAFAAMLDERFEAWGRAAITTPSAPAALPAARPKRNVLRHLRHPDVVLLGLASAIVVGVLISWFT